MALGGAGDSVRIAADLDAPPGAGLGREMDYRYAAAPGWHRSAAILTLRNRPDLHCW